MTDWKRNGAGRDFSGAVDGVPGLSLSVLALALLLAAALPGGANAEEPARPAPSGEEGGGEPAWTERLKDMAERLVRSAEELIEGLSEVSLPGLPDINLPQGPPRSAVRVVIPLPPRGEKQPPEEAPPAADAPPAGEEPPPGDNAEAAEETPPERIPEAGEETPPADLAQPPPPEEAPPSTQPPPPEEAPSSTEPPPPEEAPSSTEPPPPEEAPPSTRPPPAAEGTDGEEAPPSAAPPAAGEEPPPEESAAPPTTTEETPSGEAPLAETAKKAAHPVGPGKRRPARPQRPPAGKPVPPPTGVAAGTETAKDGNGGNDGKIKAATAETEQSGQSAKAVETIRPPPPAPPPEDLPEEPALTLGLNAGLGTPHPETPAGPEGGKSCVDKDQGTVVFCIRPIDWPDQVTAGLQSGAAVHRGTRAIVRYDGGMASRFHVIFPTESFAALVGYYTRRLGRPGKTLARVIAPLASSRRENPTVLWRSAGDEEGAEAMLEIRKFDDVRGGFPDLMHGAARLYRPDAPAIFPQLTTLEFMLMKHELK